MSGLFKKFLREKTGATAIEYSLIAVAIALAIVVIVFLLGDQVETSYRVVNDELDTYIP